MLCAPGERRYDGDEAKRSLRRSYLERNCSLLHIGFSIASSFGSAQSGRFMLGGRGAGSNAAEMRQVIIGRFARYVPPFLS